MNKSHDQPYDGRIPDEQALLAEDAKGLTRRELDRQLLAAGIAPAKWRAELEEARAKVPEWKALIHRRRVLPVVEMLELGILPSYSVDALVTALGKWCALDEEKRRQADGK